MLSKMVLNKSRPKCGEIWMANLGRSNSSVQGGYRPVFVLSNDVNNTYSPIATIIPLTSKAKRKIPVHVELNNYTKYGLKATSTLLVEQIMPIPAENMDRYIGKIEDEQVLGDIAKAIQIQFPVISARRLV